MCLGADVRVRRWGVVPAIEVASDKMIDTFFSVAGTVVVLLLLAEGAQSFFTSTPASAPVADTHAGRQERRLGADAPKERSGHAGLALRRDGGGVFRLGGSVYTRL